MSVSWMQGRKLPFIPAHFFKFKVEEEKPNKVPIKILNPHFSCPLCKGYLVDATAIVECLHTFCKSCIVKYFLIEKENKASTPATIACPVCQTKVSETTPLSSLHIDRTLQDIINKLLPDVAKNEEKRRIDFYTHRPDLFNHDFKFDKSLTVLKTPSTIAKTDSPKFDTVTSNATHLATYKHSYWNDSLITFALIGEVDLTFVDNATGAKPQPILPTMQNNLINIENVPVNFSVIENTETPSLLEISDNNCTSISTKLRFKKYIRCSERSTIDHLTSLIRIYLLNPKQFNQNISQNQNSINDFKERIQPLFTNHSNISVYLEDQKLNCKLTLKQAAIIAALQGNETDSAIMNAKHPLKIAPSTPYFTLRFCVE